jgi:AraC-like DNA-binding protein
LISSNPIPNSKVSEFVQGILVLEDHNLVKPLVLPLFANGTPTLLFLTTKGKISNGSNYLTLFGQTVFPDTLTLEGNYTMIAYFFKPYSLVSLFGVSAHELTDNPIDLNLLSPATTRQLQEQLLNAASTTEMLSLLDEYIFNLITRIKSEIQVVRFATNAIANNHDKDVLVRVQKELCVTERTFQRIFEKNVGISPNQYRRVCQFNAAFQQLQRRKFRNLTDLAFENGYADQSHYIRAFKEFTNITPSEYLNYGN